MPFSFSAPGGRSGTFFFLLIFFAPAAVEGRAAPGDTVVPGFAAAPPPLAVGRIAGACSSAGAWDTAFPVTALPLGAGSDEVDEEPEEDDAWRAGGVRG